MGSVRGAWSSQSWILHFGSASCMLARPVWPRISLGCWEMRCCAHAVPPTTPPHFRVVATARAPCYIQLRHGFGGEVTMPPLPASSRSLSRSWQLAIYPDHLPAPISAIDQVRSVSAAERSRDEGHQLRSKNLLPLVERCKEEDGGIAEAKMRTRKAQAAGLPDDVRQGAS